MKTRSERNRQKGQAMVEFAVVFPAQLFLTLVIFQFAHLYLGKLVLNYAAFTAARTALVRPDSETMADWTTNEVLPAAAISLAPVTGPSDGPAVSDTIVIPGWDSRNGDLLRRSGTALQKTRATLSETVDSQGRTQVVVNLEHDFQLIFVPDVKMLDIFNTFSGGRLNLSTAYRSPHLTLREACTLPKTWDTGPPTY